MNEVKIELKDGIINFNNIKELSGTYVYLIVREYGIRIQKKPSPELNSYGFILKNEVVYNDLYNILSLYMKLYGDFEDKQLLYINEYEEYLLNGEASKYEETLKNNIKTLTEDELFQAYYSNLIMKSMVLKTLMITNDEFFYKYDNWLEKNNIFL